MTSRRVRDAPPRSAALVETLRGLGYSTATAIADIIDNSIAASASQVDLTFRWDGVESTVAIQDDGRGMNDAELERAMRLGELTPLARRSPSDLGRFGIGLKTASFSQCRRLTVASRSSGMALACLCWDLDVLAASDNGGWYLLEGPAEGSAQLLEPLGAAEHGTLVLWECLDRIVTRRFSEQNFLDLIDGIERHLAMVFHRFLAGSRAALTIRINGKRIPAWDPFMAGHPVTWMSPVDRFRPHSGSFEIQGHVLPHRDRLTEREHESNAGPDGWTAQQGFYVYRNQRLLVAGSWLGLGRGRPWTKEEPYRLARIRLDIPNSADEDWNIDIRKSRARPPVQFRPVLTRFAEDIRERARRVFAHRGRTFSRLGADAIAEVWRTEQSATGARYRIDPDHPAVAGVLTAAGALAPDVRAMLRVIEATVPVQRIWLDTAEQQETPVSGFGADNLDELRSILEVMFRNMTTKRHMSAERARERLLTTEPFQDYPELVEALSGALGELQQGSADEQ